MTTRSTSSTILSMTSTLIEYARFGVQVCKVMSGKECTHMEIPKAITVLSNAYAVVYNKVPHISSKYVIAIDKSTFANWNKVLKSVSFPKLIDLPQLAFQYCEVLESVDLRYVTQSSGNGCFQGCYMLKELDLPNLKNVTQDFINNSGIEILKLPKVENIPYMGLTNAPELREAHLNSVKTTTTNWMNQCPKLEKVYLGKIESFNNCFAVSTELSYIGIAKGSTGHIPINKFPKLTDECLIQLFENYADFTKVVGSLTLQLTQEQYENIEGYLFMLDEKNINYEVV